MIRAAVRCVLMVLCQLLFCLPASWAADGALPPESEKPILSFDCEYEQWRSTMNVSAEGKTAVELRIGKGAPSVCELQMKFMSFCNGRCRHLELVAFNFERLSCAPEIDPEYARRLHPEPWVSVSLGNQVRQFWWMLSDEGMKTRCTLRRYDDAGMLNLCKKQRPGAECS